MSRKEDDNIPFLDELDEDERLEEIKITRQRFDVHADVRRILETREEFKRLQKELEEFDEPWEDWDEPSVA